MHIGSVKRASDLTGEVMEIRNNGVLKGRSMGFRSLDRIVTWRRGYPIIIYGAPHAGKSEVAWEISVFMARTYGLKVFVYSPETGNVEDIVVKLAGKYTGKRVRKYYQIGKEDKYSMSERELMDALDWVDRHFWLFDVDSIDGDFTLQDVYTLVEDVEKADGVVFDLVIIDPYIDLDGYKDASLSRDDKRVKHDMKLARRLDKKFNRTTIFVNHTNQITPIIKNNTQFLPMPLPQQMAGGLNWERFGFTILCVYRPTKASVEKGLMMRDDGTEWEENEIRISNQKAKPEGTGMLGHAHLFWDWKTGRYYEREDFNGGALYSRVEEAEQVSMSIEPEDLDNDPF